MFSCHYSRFLLSKDSNFENNYPEFKTFTNQNFENNYPEVITFSEGTQTLLTSYKPHKQQR